MAAPTLGALGTRLSGNTRTLTQIPVPAGTVANSMVLVYLESPALTTTYSGVPSGFTQATSSPINSSTTAPSDNTGSVYWKRCTTTDSGTYDFTSASVWTTGWAARYDGVITTGNPFDTGTGLPVSAGISGSGNDAFPNLSLTTTGADRLLLWYGPNWNGALCTQPTGFTKDAEGVTDGSDAGLAICSKTQAVAGSTGTLTATLAVGASQAKGAWLAALLPIPVATGNVGFLGLMM